MATLGGISPYDLSEEKLRHELQARGQDSTGDRIALAARLEQYLLTHPAPAANNESKAAALPEGPAKLFVGQIPREVTVDMLRQTFAPYGEIVDCVILTDRATNISKECGFVVFKNHLQADAAVTALNNKAPFPGYPREIVVKYAHSDATKRAAVGGSMPPGEYKLYVGMLSRETTEAELRQLFEPYGELKEVHVLRDRVTGQSKGSGFVKFINHPDAVRSIQSLNGVIKDKNSPGFLQVRFADTPQDKQMKNMAMGGMGMAMGMAPYGAAVGYGLPATGMYGQPPGLASPYASMPSRPILPAPASGPASTARGPPGSNLYIYGVPDTFSDADLAQLFQNFGNVISAKIFRDKMTNMPKGYGFVSYDNPQAAQSAIMTMDGFVIGNKKLSVRHKQGEPGATNAVGAPLVDPRFKPY